MKQIRCPKCNEVFTIDESNYESIVNQIRNQEFAEEIEKREQDIKARNQAEVEVLKKEMIMANNQELAKKDDEYRLMAAKSNAALLKLQQQLDQANLQLQLISQEKEKLAEEYQLIKNKELAEALAQSKEKIAQLEGQLASQNYQNSSQLNLLRQELKAKETEKELAINKALNELKENKDAEVAHIRQQYDHLIVESQAKLENQKNIYEEKLAGKEKELDEKQTLVDYYKDLKTRMSTKMIGETLEQHCYYEFNKNRMAMFPNAYFEKDNDARSGSKGDFVFKDKDEEGNEYLSIMFEMKNEADTTATKHKNEDFFKELDKDRREKGCEYAILVSLLEADNELYNEGIVDVSYRYPKMYVVRPQFFIPIISLLKNASMNSLSWKKKYEIERNNNLDVSHFEENMTAFKEGFARNYDLASKKFKSAIEEIDKTIDHLQKTKDALLGSENQLRLANNKAQDLTIKKLTHNAPSVAEKLAQIKDER